MDKLIGELQDIFRNVFDDGELILKPEMTANDIEGWDSLMHINLVIAVETHYKVKFSISEISSMKEKSQNVGTFAKMLAEKLQ